MHNSNKVSQMKESKSVLNVGDVVWLIDIRDDDVLEGVIRQPLKAVVDENNIEYLQSCLDDGMAFETHKKAWGETMSIVIKGYSAHRKDTKYNYVR